MQAQQASRAELAALARSLSQRERRARALAQAEADAAEREVVDFMVELAAVAAEMARLEPAASRARTRCARQIEGAIACAVRERSTPWLWPSRRCRTELQAARLRLVLAFLYSERLTERCPLVLEAGRVADTIISCWQVCPPCLPNPLPVRSTPGTVQLDPHPKFELSSRLRIDDLSRSASAPAIAGSEQAVMAV